MKSLRLSRVLIGSALCLSAGLAVAGYGFASASETSSGGDSAIVLSRFELMTHCGIDHAIVRGVMYRADPFLDDGNHNPPEGWTNPYEIGDMRIEEDGTATFTSGELVARFVPAPEYVPPMCF
jgi:hypothetical protein